MDNQKNVNRAYELINLIEPNNEPLYLQLKIILSNIKIKELLKNKKNEEAERIYESIKNLDLYINDINDINELNDEEELKKLKKNLKKIISDTGNLFIENKIDYYIEKNKFEEALSQCDILLEKDKKYQELKNERI